MRLRVAALALATSGAAFSLPPLGRPELSREVHHDVSAPLWLLRPSDLDQEREGGEPGRIPLALEAAPVADPVVQSTPALLTPLAAMSFEAVGQGFIGAPPATAFQIIGTPPDPQGDVGPKHYVQIVNSSFAVFSKDGVVTFGPVPTRTVFAGFGGPCETSNQGDGIVLYDVLADRWLVSQLAAASMSNGPFFECIAVSRTPDPTGAYARYAYGYPYFNDYPKLGVWPDAYYATYNMFPDGNLGTLLGIKFCAFDRAHMLTGESAPQQCVDVGPNQVSGTVPADFDGTLPPPIGEPETIVGFWHNDSLVLYHYQIDWTAPQNSMLDAVVLSVAPFRPACNTVRTGACVPQSGPQATFLDALGDRMMYRAAYRNFGGYQSLVVNHTVSAESSSGVRWYEIRNPGGDPVVFQQGTYAPDANWRWLGSAAMDGAGNIGLGFSISGAALQPAIGVTGHAVTDTPGVMGQGEWVFTGGGAQTLSLRWGDYSSLSVDPSDDCTFWYTTEYIPENGSFNWHTRLVKFQLPGCTTAPDFAVWLSPARSTVPRGGVATILVSTAALRPTAAGKMLRLSLSPLPAGLSVSPLSAGVVSAGQSAAFTVTADQSAVVGEAAFAVQAATDAATVSTSGTVVVIDSDFSIAVNRPSESLAAGGTKDFQIATSPLFGSPEVVVLSAPRLPRGITASFNPLYVRVGDSTTLRLRGDGIVRPGLGTVRVVATGALTSHSATIIIRTLLLPTVKIILPMPLANVQGTIQVSASAAASAGTTLARLDLLVDGSRVRGSTWDPGSPTRPASTQWNTNSVDDGPHFLTVGAIDADGNEGISEPVALWIQNAGQCGCSSNAGGWEALGLAGLLAATRRCRRRRR